MLSRHREERSDVAIHPRIWIKARWMDCFFVALLAMTVGTQSRQ